MKDSERRTTQRVVHHGDLLHREFMLAADKPEFLRERLLDLSVGGLSFASSQRYGEGDLIEAKIEIVGWVNHASEYYLGNPRDAAKPLVAILRVSTVRPQNGGGYKHGCEFESIDESHREALRRYLASRQRRAP